MKKYMLLSLLVAGLCGVAAAEEKGADIQVEHVGLDDLDLGDMDSLDQVPHDILEKNKIVIKKWQDMSVSEKVHALWLFTCLEATKGKNAFVDHVKEHKEAYMIGAACGTLIIVGGLMWRIHSRKK